MALNPRTSLRWLSTLIEEILKKICCSAVTCGVLVLNCGVLRRPEVYGSLYFADNLITDLTPDDLLYKKCYTKFKFDYIPVSFDLNWISCILEQLFHCLKKKEWNKLVSLPQFQTELSNSFYQTKYHPANLVMKSNEEMGDF